jgi:hypothetical protein
MKKAEWTNEACKQFADFDYAGFNNWLRMKARWADPRLVWTEVQECETWPNDFRK